LGGEVEKEEKMSGCFQCEFCPDMWGECDFINTFYCPAFFPDELKR
jgi:hypothetical protein